MTKKKSSPLLTERMGAAIRRSLCRMHAAKVMRCIQRRGMRLPASLNFCHYYFRGSFDVFFPPRPYRTARKHWGNFLSWLKYGTGRRFEKRCTPWVNVAMKSLRRCKDCRAASKNRKGRKNRCIRNERSDEMYEANDVAMMKLLVPLMKKWPSPKPKKKKFLNGVQVKEELHVKEVPVDDGPPGFGEIPPWGLRKETQRTFERGESSAHGAARKPGNSATKKAKGDAETGDAAKKVLPIEGNLRDAEVVDPMMLDPDVLGMTPSEGEKKDKHKSPKNVALVLHKVLLLRKIYDMSWSNELWPSTKIPYIPFEKRLRALATPERKLDPKWFDEVRRAEAVARNVRELGIYVPKFRSFSLPRSSMAETEIALSTLAQEVGPLYIEMGKVFEAPYLPSNAGDAHKEATSSRHNKSKRHEMERDCNGKGKIV